MYRDPFKNIVEVKNKQQASKIQTEIKYIQIPELFQFIQILRHSYDMILPNLML